MAVNKINSRSPYYVVAAGSETTTSQDTQEGRETYRLKIVQVVSGSDVESPGSGTSGQSIKLKAIPINFTPSGVYTWTGGSSSGTTAEIDVTETISGTNQEISYGCSTLDSDGNTITATAFVVSWSNTTQYTATLTVTNQVQPSISSRGYQTVVDAESTIQAKKFYIIEKLETETFSVKGRVGDSYEFNFDTVIDNDFTGTITATPSTHTGTFGSADVSLASTLSGTLTEKARYVLGASTTETIEGCPFKISLYTSNVPDNTLVPFTITGVSASDLVRGSLTGAFQVFNNGAELDFEAKLDGSAEGSETFTITLDNITNTAPNSSVKSVTMLDSITAGTPQEVQVSVTGKDTANCACAETSRETAYFRSLTGGTTLANGVFLFKNEALTIPYSSSGQYYNFVVGSAIKVGRIGATCDGRLSILRTCSSTTDCGGSIIESIAAPNEALVSSEYVENPGTDGNDVCSLVADIPVYYVGSIVGNNVDGGGATLYTNKSSTNHISNPFGGTGNWYKIILTGSDGNPADFYCKIYGEDIAGGFAVDVTPCNQSVETGQEGGTSSQVNANATVSLSMSTSDGNNQGKAYVSQRTVLSASSQNITNPSYQWSKANSGGTLVDISGATSQQLVINESGGGGETQTTTGTKIYNCSVSGTSAVSDLQIEWENRTLYSARYHTGSSANILACNGTAINLYADRNGANEFCLATAFFTDATGQTQAPGGRTYSQSTNGTNGAYKYINASPYSLDGACEGCTPPSDPTSGTILKARIQRCADEPNSPGRFEYIVWEDFAGYGEGAVLRFKDFGQTGGAGCYTVTNVYEDSFSMPTGFYVINNTELSQYLETLQPFGDCAECLNQYQEEAPVLIDPNKFYGAYRLCGVPEGTLQYIVSDSELPQVFRLGNATNTCKSLAISGNEAYNEAAEEFASNAEFFNDCPTCLGGTTPSSTGLTNKRLYELCTDTSQTLVVGTATTLYDFPEVIKFEGLSYFNPQPSSAATVVNVEDLVTYRDCASANYVPPTVTPDRPSSIKVMRISLTSSLNRTSACNTLYTYGLNVYYVGTFGDNTYLYSDPSLSTLYAPSTETGFRVNENRNSFKIGYTGGPSGIRPGAVYNFGSCSSVDIY